MNGELSSLIAIVTVGVALAGLIIVSIRRLEARVDARIDRLEASTNTRIDRLEASTNTRIDRFEASTNTRLERLEAGLAELRERMAHLEGMLDGLREAIVGRARAGSRE